MTTRTKFFVEGIGMSSPKVDPETGDFKPGDTLLLNLKQVPSSPFHSESENSQLASTFPQGNLTLRHVPDDLDKALNKFKVGTEFYVDLIPVNQPAE